MQQQHLPQKHNLRPGDRMGVWTRPSDQSLYLFGFGVYQGEQYFNGDSHPVVRLDSNPQQEYVLHYAHIFYGRESSIKTTCDTFLGNVHNINLEAFLDPTFVAPDEPEVDGVAKSSSSAPMHAPRPVTAFDKLSQLGQEVGLERKKLEMFSKAITDTEASIQAKLEEMKTLKARALSELDALEKGEEIEPLVETKPEPEPDAQTESARDEPEASESVNPANTCGLCDANLGPEGCPVCN